MFSPEEYPNLEDLFLNNEDLTGWQVMQWLRFIRGRQHIEPSEILVVKDMHAGWKLGLLKVEGNMVSLREWDYN